MAIKENLPVMIEVITYEDVCESHSVKSANAFRKAKKEYIYSCSLVK